MSKIRLLTASEISVKPKQLFNNSNGVSAMVLLYKDSRCDMAILDETFGADKWKREHRIIGTSLFCTVSVWNETISQWVSKEDVGTESDLEKKKGEASDAFKRACTNWGIGRELYTSPRIYVNLNPREFRAGEKPKMNSGVSFSLADIEYNEHREISYLVVVDGTGVSRCTVGKKSGTSKPVEKPTSDVPPPEPQEEEPKPDDEYKFTPRWAFDRMVKVAGKQEVVQEILKKNGITKVADITQKDFDRLINVIPKAKGPENFQGDLLDGEEIPFGDDDGGER